MSFQNAICAATVLVTTMTAAASPALDHGRQALNEGNLPAALDAFREIRPGNAEWAEKLQDLVLFHLRRGPALEAWRTIQVARRTMKQSGLWRDEERLAVFLAGACPLAIDPENQTQAALLNAAVYRLRGQFFESSAGGAERVAAGERLLAPGLVPYLADIPRTKLRADQGCRFAKWAVRSTAGRARAELRELRTYLDGATTEAHSRARLLVTMRALELAEGEAKNPEQARVLVHSLPQPTDVKWADLPDPERKWLFTRLVGGRKLEDVPAEQRRLAQDIALASLSYENGAISAEWLALVDLSSIPSERRVALLSRIERQGSFPGRGWVLLELARGLDEVDRANDALTVIRRLLREHEEPLDDAATESALELAGRIFAEFTFDERTTTALRAALPESSWIRMLAQTELRYAAQGRSAELARLRQTLSQSRDFRSLRNDRGDLLTALARRDLGRFRRSLDELEHHSRRGQFLADFAADFVAQIDEEDGVTPASLRPFSRELALRLHRAQTGRGELNDRWADLALSLDHSSEASRTEESVRRGIVRLGTAKWRHPIVRPPDFVLNPPDALPRRPLFFVPDGISTRGWVLATELTAAGVAE